MKIKLGQALSSYLSLCVDVSLPLRQRLDALQKEFNLFGEQSSKSLEHPGIEGMSVNALQFEASVMDGPVINTRAGLYVYLNSMVGSALPSFTHGLTLFCSSARGPSISGRLHVTQLSHQPLRGQCISSQFYTIGFTSTLLRT